MLSFDEALSRLRLSAQTVSEVVWLPTLACDRRVLALPQVAAVDAPPLDNAAMDGYALAVADLRGPATRLPVSQRIPAGSVGVRLRPGSAARIFTGAPIPAGADAVVMQELCEQAGDEVLIHHRPTVGEHIRSAGSDIAAGSEILPTGQRLRPQDTALAASVGIARLPVFRRLRVALLFTGNELRLPGEPLPPGAIYDANRFLLTALLERLGCEVRDCGQVADDLSATRQALRAAATDSDVILSSGGVSVGEEDYVRSAVEAEGRIEIWKIAIKPGKPLVYGGIRSSRGNVAFIGLPGNPVSSFVTFLMLVRPFLLTMQGARWSAPVSFLRRANFDWLRPDSRREFLRVRSTDDDGVELFPQQGAGVLSSTVWGDGLVDNPSQQIIRRGDSVRFLPFSELLA